MVATCLSYGFRVRSVRVVGVFDEVRRAGADATRKRRVVFGLQASRDDRAADDHAAVEKRDGVALGLGIHGTVEGVAGLVGDGLVLGAVGDGG